MKWMISLLFLIIASGALADYAFEITTERDAAGKCINWRDITADVSYALNPVDGTKQVTVDLPDSNSIDDDDNQEWFVGNDTNSGSWSVYFSFIGAGLSFRQGAKIAHYWLRFSKDGVLFGVAADCIVTRPGKPQKK